ncbi:carboxypeptidase N subunit 2 [Amia ocellicauda]|uniref:carboxypeptidase N subunit 2 n=1 Tax=Amia ocellicauda TaxID=2972642 RepID=UPI0034640603
MTREFAIAIFILLQLCCHGHSCPTRCQCFTPAKVFCSDESVKHVPANLSSDVKELTIMTTSVTNIKPGDFESSPNLTKIIFVNNFIVSVAEGAFDELTELQELEISGNYRLHKIGVDVFSSLTKLKKLLINFNKFSTLESGIFDELLNLEILQVKGNLLADLPYNLFSKLHQLRVLDLSQNMISHVTKDFLNGLTNLESLWLNENLIATLQSDVFSNVLKLQKLFLNGNKIEVLPQDVFSKLVVLEELNLRGNLIKELAPGLLPPQLKILNLEHNHLSELTCGVFSHLPHLTHLHLDRNKILTASEDVFQNLTKLKHLSLSENQIISLPKTIFHSLENLTKLYLHKNNLTSLDVEIFQNLYNLENLRLSHNQLSTIPEALLDAVIFLPYLSLHENPWICDCNLMYLYNWVQYNVHSVEHANRILCESPEALRGRGLVNLQTAELSCAPMNNTACRAEQIASHSPLQGQENMAAVTEASLSETETTTKHCTLSEANGMITITCNVPKCPQIKIEAQIHDENAKRIHYIFKKNWTVTSQCLNTTISITI